MKAVPARLARIPKAGAARLRKLRKRIRKLGRERRKRAARRLREAWWTNPWRLRRANAEVLRSGAVALPRGAVATRISPRDEMLHGGDAHHYFSVGYSALACVRHGLEAAGTGEVRAILDLPCGYGRVLRMLRAEYPEARIVACDLQTGGVDFCARTFGAVPLYSAEDPERIGLEERFDLIWVGSLLTHLDAPGWQRFLALFRRSLAEGGALLFSSHGAACERRVAEQGERYGLAAEDLAAVQRGLRERGFGYADYGPGRGYGISMASEPFVREAAQRAGLKLVDYAPAAWDAHHDVVTCVRAP
jgi:SAM-dependent methyltransferase